MPRWLWALLVMLAGASAPYTHTLRAHGWLVELKENHAIRAPHAHDCRFYSGRIIGEEDSRAAVAECAGEIYGVLQARGRDIYLRPGDKLKPRVMRRRDLSFVDDPPVFDLVGDTVDELDFDTDDDDDDQPRPPRAQNNIQYSQFRSPIITRPLSGVKGLWLELAIVADHTVVKFHGMERVNHYILALMNIVSAIFNDASLDSNMTLVIKKLFLYQEKDSVIKYGNVKKSLEAVNKWNYKHLDRLSDASEGWDAAVWLTRAPLGGPSGFAPVGGVCSRLRSAAINRDEGLTSAFVIAHEVAHLLGLTHDSDGDCDEESRRSTVMATTVLATLHKYAWSNCSKRQFHERSMGWWCMQDRNQDQGVVLGGAKEVSNYVFTMDEQCRTEFGDGFSVCKSVKLRSPCGRLWCAHRSLPQICHSKRAPPLEGTPCGYNRWCVDHVCELMPGNVDGAEVDSKDLIDLIPKWEEWSPWSDCDANCGYGLRLRTRQCTFNGSPSADCEGPNTEASTCWNGHECAAKWDPRAAICRDYGTSKNYIPYWPDDESKYCQALCINYKGGDIRKLGPVQNGTSCSYERPYDICFQGKCIKGECNSSDPLCNWCADGYCNNNTIFYYPKLRRDSGWTRMIVIPHDAHQLSVHISTPALIELAIREKGKNKPMIEFRHHYTKRFEVKNFADNTINYDPNVPQNLQIIEIDNYDIDSKVENAFGYEGHVIVAGTILRWKQTYKDIFITSDSPVQTDLMIMANRRHANNTILAALEVSVNYSTPANRRRPLEYRLRTEKGPCSVSCGGGQRWVRSRCVPGRQCAPVRYEACNLHKCEYTWTASYWEECSETCGENGVQERQIFCVPTNVSNYTNRMDLIYHSVSPALCFSPRPSTRQQCNQLPCPVYWEELPWTQCSTTCGRGTSIRPLSCPAKDEILCGPKPKERHKKCRLRRCPPIRPPPSCQGIDASEYCELFPPEQLTRNCIVPVFKKYCCNACRENDIFSAHHG